MATKNNPGHFDCYNNAEPDEPLFTLLARDKHAPTLVLLWAVLRDLDGEDESKIQEACQCCKDMIAFARSVDRPVLNIYHTAMKALLGLMDGASVDSSLFANYDESHSTDRIEDAR